MKLSSLIGHVVEVYDETSSSRKPADHLIDQFFRSRKYLGSHDRRFISETLYSMLRHKRRIEWITATVSTSTKKHHLYCVTSLLLDKKITKEVLVAEEILPLEILDRLEEHVRTLPSDPEMENRLAVTYSFQHWMLERWLKKYGDAEIEKLCTVLNTQAPITLRVNTVRCSVDECQQSLKREGIESVPAEFSPFGLHIPKRINVFQLETFRKGFFEVQDEGSQLLALLVDPKPRAKVIDACAGGGGKSLALAAIMKNRGEIFSLDIHEFRLDELRKRIKRAGVDTIRVKTVAGDESPVALHNAADYVLIDAPCSGTGTIRRNPGMKWTIYPEMIAELQVKQKMILSNYAQCVAPNGILVYATCSLMEEENETVVEAFLAGHPEFSLVDPKTILSRYGLDHLAKNKYFQLLPHHHGTDGFFAAVMRRSK